MLGNLRSDIRYAVRGLLARPLFLGVAVLTLALGIGANTAIFSVINGLLLNPLPFADGDRLVQVYNTYPRSGLPMASVSIPDYLDRRAQADAVEDAFLYTGQSFNLADAGAPQHVQGTVATPSMFSTLQVEPVLGRAFVEDDAQTGRDRVAVISHGLWQNRFGGAADVLGREVRLNGESFTIIGVMPRGFAFPNVDTAMWVPFAFTPDQRSDNERGNEFSNMVARLKPGATIAQFDAQMDAIVARNLDRLSGTPFGDRARAFVESSGFTGRARDLRAQWVGELPHTLALLQGVVAFVLLIACANVANLQLARLSGRGRELAVRAAMGAGLARIARMLLAESMLLALLGCLFGLLLAWGGIRLMEALGIGLAQRGMEVTLDPRVLGFALAVTAVAGLLCGLLPLLSLVRGRLFEGLRDGGRSGGAGPAARVTRGTLIVAQTALAVALLVGAGLMLRSFAELLEVDPGFEPAGLVSARMSLPDARYADDPAQEAFYTRALAEVRAVPGVQSAALSSVQPFSVSGASRSYAIENYEAPGGIGALHTQFRVIDESFFGTMGIPQLRGRAFRSGDDAQAPNVAIIDRVLAEKHFGGEDPVGRRLTFNFDEGAERTWWTIVGVVGEVHPYDLSTPVEKETIYVPYRQMPMGSSDLVVRTELAPASMVEAIRAAVLRADPEMPLYDVRTFDQRIADSLADTRAPMVLLGAFAVVALVLAVIGLYGVLAFSVGQRTRELGVRMALGADRSRVQRLVLRQGALLAGIGLAAGIALALGLGRFIAAQLHGVQPTDPVTLVVVVLVLGATALVACLLPARRAARIDPLNALRYE